MEGFDFVDEPGAEDFMKLARFIEEATPERLHPALSRLRGGVARELARLAEAPAEAASRARYQALRLFVW